ncbi:MAG: hypothetical protein WCT77_05820 [Bacteroidota bacterium]|jgi:hypothetical protein
MKNWNRKLTKEQEEKYVTICELTWGCSPIDVDWAIGTNIYKEMEAKLLLSGVIKSLPVIEPLNVKDKANTGNVL